MSDSEVQSIQAAIAALREQNITLFRRVEKMETTLEQSNIGLINHKVSELSADVKQLSDNLGPVIEHVHRANVNRSILNSPYTLAIYTSILSLACTVAGGLIAIWMGFGGK